MLPGAQRWMVDIVIVAGSPGRPPLVSIGLPPLDLLTWLPQTLGLTVMALLSSHQAWGLDSCLGRTQRGTWTGLGPALLQQHQCGQP